MNIIQQVENVLIDEYNSGMTQEEVAAKHNVKHAQIQYWLSGKRNIAGISLRTFVKMFPKATVNLTGEISTNTVDSVAIATAAVEDFKHRAFSAVVDLNLPPDAMQAVLRAIKSINLK